ncbi:TetR/AcrR family transcriptional regulator [Nonomuraea rubra]|uniref:TetR/AcrR family transcriptional regulator n=1 Tax=Nonomuraea rubra TaxID=46180 RepID=UPI003622CF6E
MTEARPRDREATRERILQAARSLFGEQGYEQVTVRMIAAAAEANIALVGRYFGSKAGLFAAVLQGSRRSASCSRAVRRSCPAGWPSTRPSGCGSRRRARSCARSNVPPTIRRSGRPPGSA